MYCFVSVCQLISSFPFSPFPHHRSCKSVSDVCPGGGGAIKTMYAWALNASGLQLPQDVGMQIGPSVKLKSLVIQIHYGHPESTYRC